MNNHTLREQAIIDASNLYLNYALPRDIPFGGWEMREFIESNTMSVYTGEPVEVILNLIDVTADALISFAESNKEKDEEVAARWLKQHIEVEHLNALTKGALADIWYDAEDHNDSEAAAIIINTQNAMSTVSSKLHTVMVGGDDE
ncbi:hypothetical protein [Vibrio sp. 10N]|uniref:hypothetical protein n=1 Tax=Vibrio sp. 10N TaxID=3058938 RepID=UPI0030C6F26B